MNTRTLPKTASILANALKANDFDILAPEGIVEVKVRTIGVVENQAPTRALKHLLPVQNSLVQMDMNQDVCQIASG